MKENENKKSVVRVTEGNPAATDEVLQYSTQDKVQRLKKPLIFGLMGVIFVGCMYLIFKPSSEKKEIEKIGLNEVVPQATGAGMPDDKGKAYEEEMLERKNQEKRNDLTSLSDYWNEDEKGEAGEELPDEEESYSNANGSGKNSNPALNSYRNVQSTLGSFYKDEDRKSVV